MAVFYEPPLQDNICPVKGYYYTLLEGTPIYAFNCGEIIKLKPNAGWTFNEFAAEHFLATGFFPKGQTLINEINCLTGTYDDREHKRRLSKNNKVLARKVILEKALTSIESTFRKIEFQSGATIPLSAGYDSNLIFHVFKNKHPNKNLFTFTHDSSQHDPSGKMIIDESKFVKQNLNLKLTTHSHFHQTKTEDVVEELTRSLNSFCHPTYGILAAHWRNKVLGYSVKNNCRTILDGWGGNFTLNFVKAHQQGHSLKSKMKNINLKFRPTQKLPSNLKPFFARTVTLLNPIRLRDFNLWTKKYYWNTQIKPGIFLNSSLRRGIIDDHPYQGQRLKIELPLISESILDYIKSLNDHELTKHHIAKSLLIEKFDQDPSSFTSGGLQNGAFIFKENVINVIDQLNRKANWINDHYICDFLNDNPDINNLIILNHFLRKSYVQQFKKRLERI